MPAVRRHGPEEKRRTSRSLTVLIPTLFLLLALLLFAGWLVAVDPQGANSFPPAGGVPPDAPDGQERTIRDPEKRQGGGTAGRGELSESVTLIEVPCLGNAVRPGDAVNIVWVSPDGGVWKKVVGRPLKVRDISRDEAIVAATPEEARAVAEARSRGRVFAAPP